MGVVGGGVVIAVDGRVVAAGGGFDGGWWWGGGRGGCYPVIVAYAGGGGLGDCGDSRIFPLGEFGEAVVEVEGMRGPIPDWIPAIVWSLPWRCFAGQWRGLLGW